MIIPVSTPPYSYDLVLESGALGRLNEYLDLDRKIAVATDSLVPPQYAELAASFCAHPYRFTLQSGEASKSFPVFEQLLQFLTENGFSRSDAILAVGGGVVGDLAGFAASVYLRGIDFYNVPTTLLSQVDSSIGGKTAIDFHGFKNLIGAFYPARRVVVDPSLLSTLPPRILSEGLAEVIKVAVTHDPELLEQLEQADALAEDLSFLVERALRIKKAVVEADPFDHGLRRVLNFGHTLGHAIESCASGSLLHGECVALGMLPMCAPELRGRLSALLKKYSLPTRIPFSAQELLPALLHDKKKGAAEITVIRVDQPGSFRFGSLEPQSILALMEDPSI